MSDSTSIVPRRMNAAAAIQAVDKVGARVVVDVRTPVEVAAEHVAGSVQIPLDELERRVDEVRSVEGDALILCKSGKRAEKAIQLLARHGIDNAILVEGGITAWAEAGGATEKGREVISLERQVRVAAGAIVVVGALLGFLVHPGLHGISAFVGAGLVFAGLTDTCAMGLLIARMPWNKKA